MTSDWHIIQPCTGILLCVAYSDENSWGTPIKVLAKKVPTIPHTKSMTYAFFSENGELLKRFEDGPKKDMDCYLEVLLISSPYIFISSF